MKHAARASYNSRRSSNMSKVKTKAIQWFTNIPLGIVVLLISVNSPTLAGIEACKQGEMPAKLNELVGNIQSSSNTHQIKSLINSYYDSLRENVSTNKKRNTLDKLSNMLSEYFHKLAKQASHRKQISNKRCTITSELSLQVAELEMNSAGIEKPNISREVQISTIQQETSKIDHSVVNKPIYTNTEKSSKVITYNDASKKNNVKSIPILASSKDKVRLNTIEEEPPIVKRPELVEMERQRVNAIETEIKFKNKFDQTDFLISKSSIERDEVQRTDLNPRTELYTTSDEEEDLLDQLDQLKARQQQIISERIEILKQRMELRGIITNTPNTPSPQSQDRLSKMTNALPEKPTVINESKIAASTPKEKVIPAHSDKIGANKSNRTENYIRISRAYIEAGKPSMALSKLKEHEQLGSKNAEHHFLSGRAYQDLKLNTDSLESYSVAIYFNPQNYKYWINRGLVKGALGDKKGALNDLTESIKLKETDLAYLNRGVTYAALNKIKNALSDLNKAIKISPSYAKAYRNRGIIFQHRGNTSEACKDWERALANGDKEMSSWIKAYCNK